MTERLVLLHNKNEIVRQGGRFEIKNAYDRFAFIEKIFGNRNNIRLESIEPDSDGEPLNENIFDTLGEIISNNDPNRNKNEVIRKLNQHRDLLDERSAQEFADAVNGLKRASREVNRYEKMINSGKHEDGTPLTKEDLEEVKNLKDEENQRLQSHKNDIKRYNLWKKEV
jgi:hypothetical protein